MDKREKVIKGLECCINEERAEPDCEHCPYGEITGTCLNLYKLHRDALELLKEQEPKTVHVSATINHRKIGECPNCGKSINSGDYPRYCGHCGQAVKWE